MNRIVVLDGHTLNPGDNPWTGLEQFGDLRIFERTDSAEFLERAGDADVLVVNKFRLGPAEFDQTPNLRLVAVTATGYDCVQIKEARQRGISVANVPVYGTDSVAQHVFALLLHICHRIDLHHQAIQAGEWQQCGEFSFWKQPLTELVGKEIGIIGFGRIGRRVGRLANAFGMQVMASTRRRQKTPSYDPFRWVDNDTLAERADVISLHCPLTDETHGMINASFLNRCKPNLILLNASRGPLIVEDDLANALNSKKIFAAGLDVASVEPINEDNPLLQAHHCFLTPHLAWATLSARKRLMNTTVENVAAFLRGAPQNVVN